MDTIKKAIKADSRTEELSSANFLWHKGLPKNQQELIVDGCLLAVSAKLTEYEIPSHVTAIGKGAFYRSKVKNLYIPDSVKAIGVAAFYYSKIENIRLPKYLSKIEDWTFAECSELKELTFPRNISSFGSNALYNLPNCIVTILCESESEQTEIYPDCFGWCDQRACVKEVRASYGSKAMRCARLWNLPFTPLDGAPKEYTYINNDFCCKGSTLEYYLGHDKIVHIPKGITAIGRTAFQRDYSGVEHLFLPASVSEIESYAFSHCTTLKTITGPGVLKIGKHAFFNAHQLSSVAFPSLQAYTKGAFSHCDSLTADALEIPPDVEVVTPKF